MPPFALAIFALPAVAVSAKLTRLLAPFEIVALPALALCWKETAPPRLPMVEVPALEVSPNCTVFAVADWPPLPFTSMSALPAVAFCAKTSRLSLSDVPARPTV